MENSELAKNFIENSDGFYDDLKISRYDNKHSEIVSKAYEELKKNRKNFATEFRDWKMQSDLSVPTQFNLFNLKNEGKYLFLLKYIYRKFFKRKQEREIKNSFIDDINIIKYIGAEKILKENPVHVTPGANEVYFVDNYSVNFRWLRYIYMTYKILEFELFKDDNIWVDVGSYYGGFQGIVKKYRPKARFVLVDFHHQLCRSYIYLSKLYPSSEHILPNKLTNFKKLNDLPMNSFAYLPVSYYKNFADNAVDFCSNIFSLGEMTRKSFCEYFNSKIFLEAKYCMLINRYQSSPFFESTYDSDLSVLDYFANKRKIEHFDVFPIGHYMLGTTTLFGKRRERNTSSSYFELITSLN